eukprot:IDg3661t1
MPQRAEFGLSAIATAISCAAERKAQIKEAQLRFACVNALPDIPAKTKLLIEMLSSKALWPTTENTANRVTLRLPSSNRADLGNLLCTDE